MWWTGVVSNSGECSYRNWLCCQGDALEGNKSSSNKLVHQGIIFSRVGKYEEPLRVKRIGIRVAWAGLWNVHEGNIHGGVGVELLEQLELAGVEVPLVEVGEGVPGDAELVPSPDAENGSWSVMRVARSFSHSKKRKHMAIT